MKTRCGPLRFVLPSSTSPSRSSAVSVVIWAPWCMALLLTPLCATRHFTFLPSASVISSSTKICALSRVRWPVAFSIQ